VRFTAFAKARATNFESPRSTGKCALADVRVLVRQAIGDAEFVGCAAEQFGRRSRKQVLAGVQYRFGI